MYNDIEFVIFTPFFKVDGDEADKLCGKYTSRTHNVAQLKLLQFAGALSSR